MVAPSVKCPGGSVQLVAFQFCKRKQLICGFDLYNVNGFTLTSLQSGTPLGNALECFPNHNQIAGKTYLDDVAHLPISDHTSNF